MRQLFNFIEANLLWIFLFVAAYTLIGLALQYRRYKKREVVFKLRPPDIIRFQQKDASGYSHKSIFTRLGGARRCLEVTVTNSEVWVRLIPPFHVFSGRCDLEHRISKSSITGFQASKSFFSQSLLLDYRDEGGHAHRLELVLREPESFLHAVGMQND